MKNFSEIFQQAVVQAFDPKLGVLNVGWAAQAFLAELKLTHAIVPNEMTPEMEKAFSGWACAAGYVPEGYAAMLQAAPKVTA